MLVIRLSLPAQYLKILILQYYLLLDLHGATPEGRSYRQIKVTHASKYFLSSTHLFIPNAKISRRDHAPETVLAMLLYVVLTLVRSLVSKSSLPYHIFATMYILAIVQRLEDSIRILQCLLTILVCVVAEDDLFRCAPRILRLFVLFISYPFGVNCLVVLKKCFLTTLQVWSRWLLLGLMEKPLPLAHFATMSVACCAFSLHFSVVLSQLTMRMSFGIRLNNVFITRIKRVGDRTDP